MDVLTMSLCECITKNSDAIKYTMQDENIFWEIKEEIVEPKVETSEIIPEEPEVKTEQIIEKSEPEPPVKKMIVPKIVASSSIAEVFIQKILEWGVKPNLIPLLRTADISLENDILIIKTTGFAEKKCRENENWWIIENIWNSLGAKTIQITLLDETKTEEPKEVSPIDAAAEIFG